ncbi:hypothetical protein SNOG_08946 [Parastagonospora nodorum SN15]|uniref:Uncharacterized protein n=1 Tax=Phaeosphaeria nodorum (strain SN15 / ATCC MYA-4574 / FGSC 10173) TaxID=321614 RepID=Q0UH18_PHANO|nr:hypothetical protein SNOG_08946 [Parastagonospora nodorum SN15]EAT84114.1 hypothetical protein SNOG_08946 [Parastagonospora nodorum SN15]
MINQPRSRSCLDCPIVLERGATDVSVSSLRCGPVADALTKQDHYVSRRLTQVRRLIPTANARTYVSSLENSKAEGVSIQSGRTGACMFQVCGYLSGMSSASAKASRPGEAAGGLRVERGATSLDKNG